MRLMMRGVVVMMRGMSMRLIVRQMIIGMSRAVLLGLGRGGVGG